jgi:hypothetical protein
VQVRAQTGKLVIVALLERLHPRHWDGHRLLQFLTGLALLALAFSAPVAPAEPAAALPPAAVVSAAEVRTAAEQPAAQDSAAQDSAAQDSAAPDSAAQDAVPAEECWHDASGYATVARPVDRTAALAGVVQRVHGSRAPPRA